MLSSKQNEVIRLIGEVTLEHRDSNGDLLGSWEYKNLIVNTGKATIAGLLNGSVALVLKYIAIGTGTNAPAVTDTGLQTEIVASGGQRALATTITRETGSVINDTMKNALTYTFSAGFTVTELGLFDAIAAGIMGCRVTFTGIPVIAAQTLTATWRIRVG